MSRLCFSTSSAVLSLVMAFQNAADLMQHGQLVRNRVAVDSGQLADKLHPLADRRADLPDVLEHAAEIDVGRLEVRLQPDAFPEGVDGAGVVAASLSATP